MQAAGLSCAVERSRHDVSWLGTAEELAFCSICLVCSWWRGTSQDSFYAETYCLHTVFMAWFSSHPTHMLSVSACMNLYNWKPPQRELTFSSLPLPSLFPKPTARPISSLNSTYPVRIHLPAKLAPLYTSYQWCRCHTHVILFLYPLWPTCIHYPVLVILLPSAAPLVPTSFEPSLCLPGLVQKPLNGFPAPTFPLHFFQEGFF